MIKRLCFLTALVFALGGTFLFADDQAPPRPAPKPSVSDTKKPVLPSRVFINVNGGFQSSTLSFGDTRTDPWFGESASWTADYRVKSGPQFDLGGGVRIWRNLLAQVSYSQFRDTHAAAIVGQVPHPFFFSQPRGITGDSPALKQQEQAVHMAAAWTIPATRHLDVTIFGGPSMFMLKRDLVSDITYAEDYPYDSATFRQATVESVSKRGLGFHAGADVTWLFTNSVGLGAVVRFTHASLALDSPANGGTVSVDLGGLQFGGGLRLRLGHTTARRTEPPSRRTPVKPPPIEPKAPQAQPRSGEGPAPPPAMAPPQTMREAPKPPSEVLPRRDRSTTVLKVAAPVYVQPDATRAALRLLPQGTSLKVREDAGDWLMVEFSDQQWEPRVGYVLKRNCDW